MTPEAKNVVGDHDLTGADPMEPVKGVGDTPLPPDPRATEGPTVSEAQAAFEAAKEAFYAVTQRDPKWSELKEAVDKAKAVYTEARAARRY